MGFQAYELFGGDGAYREQQKKAFMAGEIRNPALDYPLLDEQKLAKHIGNLEPVLDSTKDYADDDLGGVLWDSASYRMAEMYFLLEAKRLNGLSARPESEEFKLEAERYQQLNEELYGKPTEETRRLVIGEILAQSKGKSLSENAAEILGEFLEGKDTDEVSKERLPQNVGEKLSHLHEVLEEQFADEISIINDYWSDVILPRGDEKPGFNTEDMVAVYTKVHELNDPQNESGISVVIDPNASLLSWDTPSKSVKIGGKRAAITSPTDMIAKVIHEYGVHGMRAVNGAKYEIPGFGTGMYSDAVGEERSDYLTFEEGFASLCEIAMDGSFTKWKPMHISHYFALSEAYAGKDFRDTFESTWRARALMLVDKNGDISDKNIQASKSQAYVSCVRVFRGTPTGLSDGPVLTFNKDLAYLNGKLDGLKYLEKIGDDKAAISRLFMGKFDPNNHLQDKIVSKYAG